MPTPVDQLIANARHAQDQAAGLRKAFVVGCAKSGTTWLMNLLNAHPAIVCQGEGGFAYQLTPLLQQAFGLFNRHQQQNNLAAVTQLTDEQLLLTLRTLTDLQFARYIAASGRDVRQLQVVADKTPQHSIGVPVLNELYPDARFVHIIRDPRDVATSAWFHLGKHGERTQDDFIRHFMTEVWPLNIQRAREAGATLGDRYLEVQYEQLHTDETPWVERILTFVGVDASDQFVADCIKAASFQQQSGGRPRGQADNTAFYRNGQVGDWTNQLPPETVAACCEKIAPLMQACGYDSTCAVPASG